MKKLLSLFLAIAIIICAVPLGSFTLTASAATSGYYSYSLSGGEATIYDVDVSISGDVTIPSYLGGCLVTSIGDSAFSGCSNITSITIPSNIKSIGPHAFYGCGSLTTVNYNTPNCTTGDTHRYYAVFRFCSSLTTINIGENVEKIPEYIFYACEALTSITIPEGIKSIGEGAFAESTKLTTVNYNATNCTTMGTNICRAFYNCTKISTINIGENVKTIPDLAFSGCNGLKNITIPSNVTSIGKMAFEDCYEVETLTIPDNVKFIGDSAFEDCIRLESIEIGSGVESIGKRAYYNTRYYTKDYNWENNILYIGNYLVAAKEYIAGNPIIKSGVKLIANSSFENCYGIVTIAIPKTIDYIGDNAFFNCTGIAHVFYRGNEQERNNINIGINNEILDTAIWFYNCCLESEHHDYDNDCDVDCNLCGLTRTPSEHVYENVCDADCNECGKPREVPDHIYDDICDTDCNECGFVRDETHIFNEENICTECGYNKILDYITYIVSNNAVTITGCDISISGDFIIPSTIDGYSVTTIGSSSFRNCTDITSITIPNGVTSIEYRSFNGCTSLKSIIVPNSVTSIGDYAFYNCTNLTNINIPNSIISIGSYAFYNCDSLTSITIPYSVTSIGDYVFCYCNNLTSINVNDNNNYYCSIDGTLFNKQVTYLIQHPAGKTNNSYVIPDSVTNIGPSAFGGCGSLKNITIPSSVISIDYYVFEACDKLEGVYITDIAAWCNIDFKNSYGSNPFFYAENLYLNGELVTDLVIPDSVTSINDYAFYDCNSITSVTIGNGVKSIGYDTFSKCSSLTSITISDSVTKIDNFAFYNCSNLKSITLGYGVTSIGYDAFDCCYDLSVVWYRGSQAEKENIEIGSYNSYLTNATWYYNSCIGSATHTYDNNCDAECNVCCFDRVPSDHVYNNDCDEDCNECGLIRTPSDHIYDNTCDTNCNECDAEREITHTYSNNCDGECNVCGFDRVPSEHIYDDKYDANCNECGEERDVPQREWQVSADTTSVYNITPSQTIQGFNKDSITVYDNDQKVVKYNDAKQGWPLVKGQNYTIMLNFEYENANTLTWNINKVASKIFPDTSSSGWYIDAVTYAVGAGIMKGYASNGKFGTEDNLQRQDFIVMLANYEGINEADYNYKSTLRDISSSGYYKAAVNWAIAAGITTGYDNGKFGVGDNITREQIVTFLYRYAQYKGINVEVDPAEKAQIAAQYKDFAKVSSFSQKEVVWAIANGVISGMDATTINPQGNASRAQIAQIMYNIYLNEIF